MLVGAGDDGLVEAPAVGELDGLAGDPIVTDCPVLPVVVVVVVPSEVVVVVVVPPVLLVTGHDTDLALITTPGPKLQVLLALLDGLALGDDWLADGLGAAGVGVLVTGALVAAPARTTTRRVVTVRCRVVTGADGGVRVVVVRVVVVRVAVVRVGVAVRATAAACCTAVPDDR